MGAGIHGGFGKTKGSEVAYLKMNNSVSISVELPGINDKGHLSNARKAKMPKSKIVDYALNPDHPTGKHKAKVFESALGYNKDNYKSLIKQIKQNVGKYKATQVGQNEHGVLYQVIMPIKGPNGKTKDVVTGWIIKNGDYYPSLTTLYVKKEK